MLCGVGDDDDDEEAVLAERRQRLCILFGVRDFRFWNFGTSMDNGKIISEKTAPQAGGCDCSI